MPRAADCFMAKPGEEDERLEFPLAVAGRIIGSRGVQISEVRSRSGAQVKIEKLEETCRVYLGGSPEQVEKAKKMIVSLAEENHLPGRGDAEDTVEIPLSMVGRVIGKGGETVQRLQRESGAKIDVNNQLDPSPVRLSGTRDAITRAKYLLREAPTRGIHHQNGECRKPIQDMMPGPCCPGYVPQGMPQSMAQNMPRSMPTWDLPAGDGGGGGGWRSAPQLTNSPNAESKSEEIDLDEL
ncbi:Far upstream element-binding protein 1 (FBP) (FUSE-binding protein 1) (DNA helicase V) (hDH V) [Durusdinium trenchii]|uniref:Far upstream element-binding protein 1 (FBP) (FUSE-binding protein 1) (DNA helicase V) (HDH V) n=1 Tax=Durusdinium trenchii TaxID=1381693 RepID=A0ABP0L4T6_9DINO